MPLYPNKQGAGKMAQMYKDPKYAQMYDAFKRRRKGGSRGVHKGAQQSMAKQYQADAGTKRNAAVTRLASRFR